MKTPTLFLMTLLCAAFASLQGINANTITVTNTNDSGAGSLRQALVDAVDGDTIDFSVTGTITLTSGQLVVGRSVTISGPGASNLAVDGNAQSRVFYVNPGRTVVIDGLTIANGHPTAAGGGVWNQAAALTISNCVLSGNTPNGAGGGVLNYGYGGSATLTINNCTISGNSANGYGGGVFNLGYGANATLTVSNSTISGNSAWDGGGLFNYGYGGASATATVSNSTFNGNSGGYGGGVMNYSGYVGVYGIATVTVSNSTISGNSAYYGGGVCNFQEGFGGSSTAVIGNTILNASSPGQNIYNRGSGGTITSLGYNLSSDDASAFLNQPGDLNSTDPMLGPLQDNGGLTFTHELLTGSPAIDAGDPSFTPPPDYDQRGAGFNRVVSGRIDIGAFEVQTIVCPQPQGYWKVNPDEWPVTSLTLGSQTYTETELLAILRSRVGGDASLILAFQLIAAKLNIANGANGTPVTTTITDADAVLSLYTGKLPYRVRPNSTNGQRMVTDGAVLENYNKGLLTPGCTPTPTPTPSPTP